MPLQATSGAASYDAFGGGVPVVPNYIEEVFSCFLYTGNGTSQTITNGIDLSGKGGAAWMKARDAAFGTVVQDTARGVDKFLLTHSTNAEASSSATLNTFNSNGFTVGSGGAVNQNTNKFVSWTFRKQPKFFDVVTYTGNGGTQNISHNLGSVPGCIIVKRLNNASNTGWPVYHRYDYQQHGFLNLDNGFTGAQEETWFGNNLISVAPTSTVFTVGSNQDINANTNTYVAYLFAHNAGGFGLTGTDNVVSCGSFATDGSGNATVSLGYEPQWILFKTSTLADDWRIFDVTRGLCDKYAFQLNPNTQAAEANIGSNGMYPTATGFVTTGYFSASQTVIYVAIRRGPMKVPTSGTSVFAPVAYTGTNVDNRLVDTGILTDMTMARIRTTTSTGGFYTADRLRGNTSLATTLTDAENTDADSFMTPTVGYGGPFSAMNGFGVGNDVTRQLNQSSTSQLAYAFKRAPSFFDEVCYTGTGVTSRTFNHNLTVVPELIIYKSRDLAVEHWGVYTAPTGIGKTLWLDTTNNAGTLTQRTLAVSSTTVTIGDNDEVNKSGSTYIAYLFATCAGVSKVGGYTGTGTTLQIDCGFASGARFVLIKRTDSTGDWYVWDSARGIVSGNDPYLLLNSTAAEVTNTDYIDTYSAGFEISSTAPAAINSNTGTFIFLAIA
jgi:hypothetical protein